MIPIRPRRVSWSTNPGTARRRSVVIPRRPPQSPHPHEYAAVTDKPNASDIEEGRPDVPERRPNPCARRHAIRLKPQVSRVMPYDEDPMCPASRHTTDMCPASRIRQKPKCPASRHSTENPICPASCHTTETSTCRASCHSRLILRVALLLRKPGRRPYRAQVAL